mmetsp:Transcript_6367/g.14687  ORF Transcript_6367/g.14687 Transcript_6367/m.14687 type:complete len:230 (+) Transcript_6367:1182-1871(+)
MEGPPHRKHNEIKKVHLYLGKGGGRSAVHEGSRGVSQSALLVALLMKLHLQPQRVALVDVKSSCGVAEVGALEAHFQQQNPFEVCAFTRPKTRPFSYRLRELLTKLADDIEADSKVRAHDALNHNPPELGTVGGGEVAEDVTFRALENLEEKTRVVVLEHRPVVVLESEGRPGSCEESVGCGRVVHVMRQGCNKCCEQLCVRERTLELCDEKIHCLGDISSVARVVEGV